MPVFELNWLACHGKSELVSLGGRLPQSKLGGSSLTRSEWELVGSITDPSPFSSALSRSPAPHIFWLHATMYGSHEASGRFAQGRHNIPLAFFASVSPGDRHGALLPRSERLEHG